MADLSVGQVAGMINVAVVAGKHKKASDSGMKLMADSTIDFPTARCLCACWHFEKREQRSDLVCLERTAHCVCFWC